jgi:hypothetical protein
MFRLDAPTVLLQWSVGGLAFLWFTTRRRMVGIGYGWLLRSTYALLAALGVVLGFRYGVVWVREISAALVVGAAAVAFVQSVRLRSAGVSGQTAEHDRRTAQVAAMTGIERTVAEVARVGDVGSNPREFDPRLDLVAPIVGVLGLVAGAVHAAGPSASVAEHALSLVRTLAGAVFLGAITDAMLLGHWYLVQPGLPRRLLNELVAAVGWVWPIEVVALLVPTGMLSVLTGSVDDGWNGLMFWMWATCAVTTIGLVWVTTRALKERYYSAVMAATGLLYLAILTAFGTDLVARAVLDN